METSTCIINNKEQFFYIPHTKGMNRKTPHVSVTI